MTTGNENLLDGAPGWVYQSGISVVAIGVACLLVLSLLIKYPDVTPCVGFMASDRPPIDHKSSAIGVIDSICVKTNSIVKTGDRLVMLQTTCNRNDLETIKDFLAKLEAATSDFDYVKINFPSGLYLGELQSEYAGLELVFLEFVNGATEQYSSSKIAILKAEVLTINRLDLVVAKQVVLFEKDAALLKLDNERNKSLRLSNVISDQDMEKSDRELIALQKQLGILETSRLENEMRKAGLELEIQNLSGDKVESNRNRLLKLSGLISSFGQSIRNWEERYFITAKISGRVLFGPNIAKKVKLDENAIVASIIPERDTSNQYINALVPGYGAGTIKRDAKVIVHVDGYPHNQFGSVISKVATIAPIPHEDNNGNLFYDVRIQLPKEIITSYNIKIPFKPNTRVTANIVVNDQSLFKRVFKELLNLIYQD